MTASVRLFHRDLGGAGNPPLVILHGLLGSSRNWSTSGRKLASAFHVRALDLRNHGASPHADEMSFPALAADVLAFLDAEGLSTAHLMGHSLGGKVAMRFACDHPERLGLLYVLDMAPRAYPPEPSILEAMAALDLAALKTRTAAQEALAAAIPDAATRLFVLTNLTREPSGGFRWQVNLEALRRCRESLAASPLASRERHEKPTQFVLGGESPYVGEADEPLIRRHFPAAEIETIAGSGHNVHIENGDRFDAAVVDFARRHGVLSG